MFDLQKLAQAAKDASYSISTASATVKENALMAICDALMKNTDSILEENKKDIEHAKERGITKAMLDRLTLTKERICGIAEGVKQVCALADPVGEVISMWKRPNGLMIGQKRVPIGVIGIIYEARPNVTVDAAALCLKSSNVAFLRGGSEAFLTNRELVRVMRLAIASVGMDENCICFVEDPSRAIATEMMRLNGYIDVLIPRGGAGLIKSVVNNSTLPVIETGIGNCHIYVDGECDQNMAMNILINAKVSRPSVCNAAENLIVDSAIAQEFLPKAVRALESNGVEVRGCKRTKEICPDVNEATEEDFYTEYNDYIISVKVVDGIDEAIEHINRHNTKHSEAIVTTNYVKSQKFLDKIDAAAVYVNASTRFTDGFEFGFGAEIGISTQKIHARGPMGLKELTTIKYIIYGDGQIR